MQKQQEMPIVFLQRGELFVASGPAEIKTLLGSCVAVVIHEKGGNRGAMCHAVFPSRAIVTSRHSFEYVDQSIEHMVRKLNDLGVSKVDMLVKLFGGAEMVSSDPDRPASVRVGEQNILAARSSLQRHGLRILDEKVGGNRGYKISYYSESGIVIMGRLSTTGMLKLQGER